MFFRLTHPAVTLFLVIFPMQNCYLFVTFSCYIFYPMSDHPVHNAALELAAFPSLLGDGRSRHHIDIYKMVLWS